MDCRGWFLVFGRSENGLIHPHLSPSRLVVQVQRNLPKLATPGARTYLMSALLAFGVYEKVGQRAANAPSWRPNTCGTRGWPAPTKTR